jgi:hypothetical protein
MAVSSSVETFGADGLCTLAVWELDADDGGPLQL